MKQPKEVEWVIALFPKVNFSCQPTGECYQAAFLIYEKTARYTGEFFSFISKNSPTLKKYCLPFVTDREVAITTAIKNKLPIVN